MTKVQLNVVQMKFIKEMLEIEDNQQAMQKFADLMSEERLELSSMPKVIDRIIIAMKNRVKK